MRARVLFYDEEPIAPRPPARWQVVGAGTTSDAVSSAHVVVVSEASSEPILLAAGRSAPVIVTTTSPSLDGALAALRKGAFDYVRHDEGELVAAIERSLAEVAARLAVGRLPYREALSSERRASIRRYLMAALDLSAGSVTRAAERAGIERESFYRLCRRHGIRPKDTR